MDDLGVPNGTHILGKPPHMISSDHQSTSQLPGSALFAADLSVALAAAREAAQRRNWGSWT